MLWSGLKCGYQNCRVRKQKCGYENFGYDKNIGTKILGTKKLCPQKYFGTKILGTEKVMPKKNCVRTKKNWLQKKTVGTKIFGTKKIWVRKNYAPQKNLVWKFRVRTKYYKKKFGMNILDTTKNVGTKIVGREKKIGYEKNLDTKKGYEKKLGTKICVYSTIHSPLGYYRLGYFGTITRKLLQCILRRSIHIN